MSEAGSYEADFVLWSERQARLLREAAARRANEPIDWENLAKEVESLGRSQRHEVASLVGLILVHRLKLEHSPAEGPRRGWRATILRCQRDLRVRLDTSPSLGRTLQEAIADGFASSVEIAALELEQHGEWDAAKAVRGHRDPPSSAEVFRGEG